MPKKDIRTINYIRDFEYCQIAGGKHVAAIDVTDEVSKLFGGVVGEAMLVIFEAPDDSSIDAWKLAHGDKFDVSRIIVDQGNGQTAFKMDSCSYLVLWFVNNNVVSFSGTEMAYITQHQGKRN